MQPSSAPQAAGSHLGSRPKPAHANNAGDSHMLADDYAENRRFGYARNVAAFWNSREQSTGAAAELLQQLHQQEAAAAPDGNALYNAMTPFERGLIDEADLALMVDTGVGAVRLVTGLTRATVHGARLLAAKGLFSVSGSGARSLAGEVGSVGSDVERLIPEVEKIGSRSADEMALDLKNDIGQNSISFRTVNKSGHIDLTGKSHYDKVTKTQVPTPHVQTYDVHTGPNGQIGISRKSEIVVSATKADIRMARLLAEQQGLISKNQQIIDSEIESVFGRPGL